MTQKRKAKTSLHAALTAALVLLPVLLVLLSLFFGRYPLKS